MTDNKTSVVCFHDFESAAEHEPAWIELAANNPLLTWTWMNNWWKHLGIKGGLIRKLALAMVRDRSGRVLGIAPFYVSSNLVSNNLRFLGDGITCTDYIDILVRLEDRELVGHKLAEWIQSNDFHKRFGQLDSIVFEGLSETATGIQSLGQRLIDSKWKKVENPLEGTWSLDLQNGIDGVCKQLNSSQKRKVRKALKRQTEGTFELEVVESVDQFANDWQDFVELHQKRRNFLREAGCFVDCQFDQFLCEATKDLMVQGKSKLIFLKLHDHRIATNLLFFADGVVFNYQNGSDPDYSNLEPGHGLNALAIAWSCQRAYTHFDFLRGDERYKKDWGAKRGELIRHRYIAPRWAARAKESFRQSAKGIRDQSRAWLRGSIKEPEQTKTDSNKDHRELENSNESCCQPR